MPILHHTLEALTFMTVAGFVLTVTCCGYIHKVSRMEHLSLRTCHDLEIVKIKTAA